MTKTDKTRVQLAVIVVALSVLVPAFASAQPGRTTASTSSRHLTSGTPVPFSPVGHLPKSFWDGGEAAHRAYLASLPRPHLGPRASARREQLLSQWNSAPTAPAAAAAPSSGSPDWYAIAQCEAGGRWDTNSGNGYWGGLQFAPSTWFAYGGGPFDGMGPFPYSSAEQIAVGERVYAAQGPGAWPNCFQW
jgi:hypothetical protein